MIDTRTCFSVLQVIRFFFFNDTATTEIYTLSLHDALPIWAVSMPGFCSPAGAFSARCSYWTRPSGMIRTIRQTRRSEEHTSELQSRQYLVCRLLLEKKNKILDHMMTRLNYIPYTLSYVDLR